MWLHVCQDSFQIVISCPERFFKYLSEILWIYLYFPNYAFTFEINFQVGFIWRISITILFWDREVNRVLSLNEGFGKPWWYPSPWRGQIISIDGFIFWKCLKHCLVHRINIRIVSRLWFHTLRRVSMMGSSCRERSLMSQWRKIKSVWHHRRICILEGVYVCM